MERLGHGQAPRRAGRPRVVGPQRARADQARKLAEAGYVAFALDMYGKGKVTTHPDDAMKFMSEATKDPAVVKARFDAAMAALKPIRTWTRRGRRRSATASAAASS